MSLTKITTLTEKDRARFKEWADKWIRIGLSTDEADWGGFERGVNECYLLSGLVPVKIIKVNSPIVGALASSIAALILSGSGNEYNAVYNAVRNAVGNAVDNAIGNAVYNAVGNTVDSTVRNAVYSTVRNAVDNAVDSTVRNAVGNAVDNAVRNAIGNAVDNAIGNAVYSTVRNTVDNAVYSTVDSTVRNAVRNAVDNAVRNAVGNTVGNTVDNAVYSTVRNAVDNAVDSTKQLFWHYWMGGQFWSYWQAYVTFFTDVMGWTPEGNILQKIKAYELAQKSACYWWPNKNFIMVCNRPKHIYRNKEGQLHSEKGQAIEWRDGWGLYVLNGVRVSKELVMTPSEQLDPKIILKEPNVEIRREIVRKIGIERVCQQLGAKTLDEKYGYKLLTLNLGDGRNRPYLKMVNPSTGTYHLEGIKPTINMVDKALSWRNGTKEYEEPLILT